MEDQRRSGRGRRVEEIDGKPLGEVKSEKDEVR